MSLRRSLVLGLLVGGLCSAARAQQPAPAPVPDAPAPVEDLVDEDPTGEDAEAVLLDEVVVTGQRRRGAALGDIPPEVELNAQEIRALGAGSITELLEVLEPQIRSNRGRAGGQPVVLLNGRRISGFSEIRGIPPEAIERFEVLPEEVGLRYGYRADQRVVNIVLRERFRSRTVELEAGGPTSGGRSELEADLAFLRINRRGRTNLDVEHRRAGALLESDRDVLQTQQGAPFDVLGNVGGVPFGAEIDPGLSALAGRAVTVAGVPATAGALGLSDFAATAGAPNVTDLGDARTLLPQTERLSVNGTVNRTVLGDVSATLNARYDLTGSRSLFGLPSGTLAVGADNPFSPFGTDVQLFRLFNTGVLTRENESDTGHLGLVLDSFAGDWRWTLTANYDRTDSRTVTDRGVDLVNAQARVNAGDPTLNPFGPIPEELVIARARDRGRSLSQTADAELVVNGTLRELGAGPLATTVRTTLETRDFRSESFRSGVETEAELSRRRGAVQANLDIPIASRRREVRSWLGDLSANLNAELDQLSDFGTLTTLGGGITWSPKTRVTLLASFTEEDGAPSVQQLGDPVLFTPNVAVFDFARGETVEVVSVEGGNPALVADSRRVVKLGATLRPWEGRDLSLTANYTVTRIADPISSFPGATAEIEAAFPERFLRDATGRLVQVDTRPVNFARSDRRELRYGLNWSKPLRPAGAAGPEAPGAARGGLGPEAAPGAGRPADRRPADATPPEGLGRGRERGGGDFGRGGPGGFGGGRFGRPGEGRIQVSLYHTYRIEDSVLIREGTPELDFLHGSAVGSRGGRSRHELDAQLGLFKSGYGAVLNARHQSGSTVIDRTGTDGDLEFSGLTTVNLRLFADLGQQRALVQRHGWLRGARVTLALNNLFDARQDVRDAAGAVPISFQPDLLDPVGRSVRISVRKAFFGRPAGQRRRERAAREQ